jgi:hypothetical protein
MHVLIGGARNYEARTGGTERGRYKENTEKDHFTSAHCE